MESVTPHINGTRSQWLPESSIAESRFFYYDEYLHVSIQNQESTAIMYGIFAEPILL
jgi:hypothetical protein